MTNNIRIESETSFKEAISLIRNEKLVALKTETVYGVACDPSSLLAIKKVYEIKNRPKFNPLIIHVNSIQLAEKIAFLNEDCRLIMKEFWPGPLTLILPRKKSLLIHENAVSGLDTIAVRYPESTFINKIIGELKKPLAAPSANESGYISPTDAEHVFDSFGTKIDLVVDSGRTKYGLESTILDMTSNPYEIKRFGVIDSNLIKNKLGKKIEVLDPKNNKILKPNSPGQLLKHYAPKTPLKINTNKPCENDAFLNFGSKIVTLHKPTLNLSESSNLNEAAFNLFFFLRKLDKYNKKRIVVAPIPNDGIGKTINERLKRASS